MIRKDPRKGGSSLGRVRLIGNLFLLALCLLSPFGTIAFAQGLTTQERDLPLTILPQAERRAWAQRYSNDETAALTQAAIQRVRDRVQQYPTSFPDWLPGILAQHPFEPAGDGDLERMFAVEKRGRQGFKRGETDCGEQRTLINPIVSVLCDANDPAAPCRQRMDQDLLLETVIVHESLHVRQCDEWGRVLPGGLDRAFREVEAYDAQIEQVDRVFLRRAETADEYADPLDDYLRAYRVNFIKLRGAREQKRRETPLEFDVTYPDATPVGTVLYMGLNEQRTLSLHRNAHRPDDQTVKVTFTETKDLLTEPKEGQVLTFTGTDSTTDLVIRSGARADTTHLHIEPQPYDGRSKAGGLIVHVRGDSSEPSVTTGPDSTEAPAPVQPDDSESVAELDVIGFPLEVELLDANPAYLPDAFKRFLYGEPFEKKVKALNERDGQLWRDYPGTTHPLDLKIDPKFTYTSFLRGPQSPPAEPAFQSLVAWKPEANLVRVGAVADGESRLLVRVRSAKAGKLIACEVESDDLPQDSMGTCDVLFQGLARPGVIEGIFFDEPSEDYYAFALYQPPRSFPKLPHDSNTLAEPASGPRPLDISVEWETRPPPDEAAGETDAGPAPVWTRATPLLLRRPPVVLVHGTYDNPIDCWDWDQDPAEPATPTFAGRLADAGFRVYLVDYQPSNGLSELPEDGSHFRDNEWVVWFGEKLRNSQDIVTPRGEVQELGADDSDAPDPLIQIGGIETALDDYRSRGIAITRVDVVGHSMGGVLARVYARGRHLPACSHVGGFLMGRESPQGPNWYFRPDNFYAGDINRLITIGSTHKGSHIPGLLQYYPELYTPAVLAAIPGLSTTIQRNLWSLAAWATEGRIHQGALTDQIPPDVDVCKNPPLKMTPPRPALCDLGPTLVPAHAIAGVATVNDFYKFDGLYRNQAKDLWDKTATDKIGDLFDKLKQSRDGEELLKLVEQASWQGTETDGSNPLWSRPSEEALLRFWAATFANDQNDCTVSLDSQLGGLDDPYVTVLPETDSQEESAPAEGVLHGFEPRYPEVQSRVLELLTAPDMTLFSPVGFPPPEGPRKYSPGDPRAFKPSFDAPALAEAMVPPDQRSIVQELARRIDPETLIELVHATGDPIEADRLYDASQIEDLLTKVDDIQELLTLLRKIAKGGILEGTSPADILEKILSFSTGPEQAARLLDRIPNGVLLLDLLEDIRNARTLEEFTTKVTDGETLKQLLYHASVVLELDSPAAAARLKGWLDTIETAEQVRALLEKAGGAESLTEFLEIVADGQVLDRLLNHASKEKLHAWLRTIDDAKEFAALLKKAGGAESLSGFIEIVSDGGLLDRLLDHAGQEKLRSWLRTVDDASQFAALLEKAGGAESLSEFIEIVSDGGHLDRLLAATTAKGGAPARLKTLLESLAETQRNLVDPLLQKTADFRQLEEFLESAGGEAKLLDEVLDLAHSGDASNAASLLNLARNAGTTREERAEVFRRLGEEARLFERRPVGSPPQPGNLHGYNRVRMDHFLDRHTYDWFHFNSPNTARAATIWPKGFTQQDVADLVQEALDELHAMGRTPAASPAQFLGHSGFEELDLTLPSGWQIGIGADKDRVMQFYPSLKNPTLETLSRNELRALRDLFNGRPTP